MQWERSALKIFSKYEYFIMKILSAPGVFRKMAANHQAAQKLVNTIPY